MTNRYGVQTIHYCVDSILPDHFHPRITAGFKEHILKASFKTLLVAMAAAGAASASIAGPNGFGTVNGISYEQVRFYKPSSTSFPTQVGALTTDHCAGADKCGEPMKFTSTYGGDFKATAVDNTSNNGIVMQDLSPYWGGLGVRSQRSDGSVYGDDEIDRGETLKLSFEKTVTIVGLHFFDGNHTRTESGDKGKLSIDGGSFKEISLRSYVTSNSSKWFTGKTFTFGHVNNDYYLGAVKLMQPVPEPESYALMLAGLATLGFVMRRSRAA